MVMLEQMVEEIEQVLGRLELLQDQALDQLRVARALREKLEGVLDLLRLKRPPELVDPPGVSPPLSSERHRPGFQGLQSHPSDPYDQIQNRGS